MGHDKHKIICGIGDISCSSKCKSYFIIGNKFVNAIYIYGSQKVKELGWTDEVKSSTIQKPYLCLSRLSDNKNVVHLFNKC